MKKQTTEAPKNRNTAPLPFPLSTISFRHGPAVRGPVLTLSVFAALALSGCTGTRALKGGKAFTERTPAGGLSQVLLQSENPSVPSRQSQETIKVRAYTLPAPPSSSIQNPVSSISGAFPPSATNPHPSTFLVTEREESRSSTELGAAQKDTAREVGAKLSSLKGLVCVGLVMFVFGIASFAWPPLKAIIGSVTTSAAITLGGVALMILPSLIVGHEVLILGGVAVTVGAWFLAHRHGRLHGQLAASTQYPRSLWN